MNYICLKCQPKKTIPETIIIYIAYTGNCHRIATRTPSSPPMGQSGPTAANSSSSTAATITGNQFSNMNNNGGQQSSSSSSLIGGQMTTNNGNNNGNGNNNVLYCPICSISLDGIDINQHFFEEMHKIDSMRK